jgi:sporulation protein YlmC with PRC-barrel domain
MKFFLKKKLVIAALVPAIGMPIAVSSLAQTSGSQGAKTGQSQQQSQAQQGAQPQQGQQGNQGQQAKQIRDMRASEIIGANVQSAKGQNLGDVQDLIVNVDDGKVNYAIVAFGGVLGFGEKLFAYPMDRFQASSDGKELVLRNVNEEQMKNAPGFDKSSWPTFGSGGYRGEVQKHFGQTAQAGGNLVRMSEVLGNKVVDRIGNGVGQVEDVVVSVTDGKVRYVALEPANDLNMGDRMVMLPMNAIRATGEQKFKQQQQAQQGKAGQSQQAQQSQSGGSAMGQQGQSGSSQQQAREGQSGQSQQQAEQRQPGQSQQSSAQAGRQTQQQGGQQQQQQAQKQDQDLQLVLNVEPKQLQKARTFQQDQWPDLNNQAFQREMDSYVASFPSGQKAGSTAGASGGQGQTGSSASRPATQQKQSSGDSSAQQEKQQPQQGTTGQTK